MDFFLLKRETVKKRHVDKMKRSIFITVLKSTLSIGKWSQYKFGIIQGAINASITFQCFSRHPLFKQAEPTTVFLYYEYLFEEENIAENFLLFEDG